MITCPVGTEDTSATYHNAEISELCTMASKDPRQVKKGPTWTCLVGEGSKHHHLYRGDGRTHRFVGPKRPPATKKDWEPIRAHRKKLDATRIRNAYKILNKEENSLEASKSRARRTLENFRLNWRPSTTDQDKGGTDQAAVAGREKTTRIGSGNQSSSCFHSCVVDRSGAPQIVRMGKGPCTVTPETILWLLRRYHAKVEQVGPDRVPEALAIKAAAVVGVLVDPKGIDKLPVPDTLKRPVRCWNHYFYPGEGLERDKKGSCPSCCGGANCEACCNWKMDWTLYWGRADHTA